MTYHRLFSGSSIVPLFSLDLDCQATASAPFRRRETARSAFEEVLQVS